MNIEDFLPSYPSIQNSEYESLSPYQNNLNDIIFHKKEFYDNKLPKIEYLPKEKGVLLKHQLTIARYMSSNTLYDGVLLVHEMGSGKTCSAVGAIEQIRSENSSINGAIIFASGDKILDNFKREIALKCTHGQYRPEKYETLNAQLQTTRINKLVSEFYDTKDKTFTKFSSNVIGKLTDSDLKDNYSNKIIVIDEVHNLRIQEGQQKDKQRYYNFHRFLHVIENCKIILLSGTPMKSYFDISKYDYVLIMLFKMRKNYSCK